MSDYVRIQKGSRELTVSEKAFNSIYKEKGFELIDGKSKAAKSHEVKGKGRVAKGAAKGKGKTEASDLQAGDEETGS